MLAMMICLGRQIKLLFQKEEMIMQQHKKRRKVCYYCQNKLDAVDFKNTELLRKFVSERGKILPRRATGACAKHQRMIAVAIKRARHMALLPFVKD